MHDDRELLNVQVVRRNGAVEIRVAGEIDASTAPDIERAVRRCAAGGAAHVTVDLSGVSFCGAAGIRALLEVAAGDRGAPSCELVAPSPAVRRVANLTDTAALLFPDAPPPG